MSELEEQPDYKGDIIAKYFEVVEKNEALPTVSDMLSVGVTRAQIRHHFGNIENLHAIIGVEYVERLSRVISTQRDLFTPQHEIKKRLTKTKFLITTAVAGKKADTNFLAACDTFCRENDAQILVLPCENITNSFQTERATFDPVFNDPKFTVVADDVFLNSNLMIRGIQVSAKQIKPTTGLIRLGEREGSYIFAAPKQFLEHTAAGNNRFATYAVMTTGACTVNDYRAKSHLLSSKRTEYIAENDHQIGGIIVELVDDRTFHFRHFQADDSGSFIDLGIRYRGTGTERVPVWPSIEVHTGSHDEDLISRFLEFCGEQNVRKIFVHDGFDGSSISHHDEHNIVARVRAAEEAESGLVGNNLRSELWRYRFMMEELAVSAADGVAVVKSNHDEWLDRYLREGRYVNDPTNHRFALKIADLIFQEDVDVLEQSAQIATESYFDPKAKIQYHRRSGTFLLGATQMVAHGDQGLNGSQGTLAGLERIYGSAVVGHAHSAAILRNIRRIGTATRLDLGYNVGPSSWTQGFGLTYEDGTGQIINFIQGEFHV